MKMTTLSRRHWRELIRTHLERWDPIHSRWLQEHPRQTEILNEVVTDAIDVWCQAMAARQDPNWPPDPWTRLDLDELEQLIVARTVETPELWEDLAETYPRTTAAVAAGADRADAAAGDPTYRPDTATLAPSSLTDRARRNLTALATLDHIDQRGGLVTDHDRARLGLWTGWGALPQLFDPTVDREPFAGLRRDLEQRLDAGELRAASASTLNAHYTDPAVIDAVWRLCTAAGFDGGRVLEPGCGSGLFIGLAPDEVRRASRFVGVELEPTTARIAAALYPEAEIRACGLETVREPDGCYDLAVGNVPFGKYALFDPIHNPDRASDPQLLRDQGPAPGQAGRPRRHRHVPLHARRPQPRRPPGDVRPRRPHRGDPAAERRPPTSSPAPRSSPTCWCSAAATRTMCRHRSTGNEPPPSTSTATRCGSTTGSRLTGRAGSSAR